MTRLYPLRLTPSPQERIWGATNLEPYFGEFPDPIGEIWYSFEENVVADGPLAGRSLASLMAEFGPRLMGASYQPQTLVRRSAGWSSTFSPPTAGPYFPILVKILFAAQTLSVQVHPDDAYALEHEGGPGKTELWYIVDAKEGACVALGLTDPMTQAQLVETAQNGEIENYLNWIPVQRGDVLMIPPGMLHTLGEGVTVCEIQQNSDLTYRFFDFGRLDASGKARALHIERGAEVVRMEAPAGKLTPVRIADPLFDRRLLATCPYFSAESLSWSAAAPYQTDGSRFHLLTFLEGRGHVGTESYRPGDCFLIPASAEPFVLRPEEASVALRSFVPPA